MKIRIMALGLGLGIALGALPGALLWGIVPSPIPPKPIAKPPRRERITNYIDVYNDNEKPVWMFGQDIPHPPGLVNEGNENFYRLKDPTAYRGINRAYLFICTPWLKSKSDFYKLALNELDPQKGQAKRGVIEIYSDMKDATLTVEQVEPQGKVKLMGNKGIPYNSALAVVTPPGTWFIRLSYRYNK